MTAVAFRRSAIAIGLLTASLGIVAVGAAVIRATAASVRVYVTVVDEKGQAVPGLTAADFRVAIDSAPQEVLSAGPATEPLHIVILTDRLGGNSTYTAYDVHQALGQFVKAVRAGNPDVKFALTTFDGPVVQLTKFTSAPAELDRMLGRLSTSATDAMMLDALAEACQMLANAPSDRRAVFTLVAAYRSDQSTVRNEAVAEMLRVSGASLWTVEARAPEGGNFGNAAREVVIDRGGLMSGGLHTTVASRVAVEAASKQLAGFLVSQYEIVYAPGGGRPGSTLTIGTTKPGLRVLAPSWTK